MGNRPDAVILYVIRLHGMIYEYKDTVSGEEISIYMGFNANYLFDDGTESFLPAAAVWCYTCDQLTPAESFLIDKPKWDLERQKYQNIILGRSKHWPYPGECPTQEQATTQLDEKERFWARFDDRKTPPRCLVCAGFDFVEMKLNDITKLRDGRQFECTAWLTAPISNSRPTKYNHDGRRVG